MIFYFNFEPGQTAVQKAGKSNMFGDVSDRLKRLGKVKMARKVGALSDLSDRMKLLRLEICSSLPPRNQKDLF